VFGINGAELVVLLFVAALVIGPERLPRYAEQLAGWVRTARRTLSGARQRLSAELGEDDIDWAALDPRRYDPRRIVREALGEPTPLGPGGAGGPGGPGRGAPSGARLREGETAPFDDEAT